MANAARIAPGTGTVANKETGANERGRLPRQKSRRTNLSQSAHFLNALPALGKCAFRQYRRLCSLGLIQGTITKQPFPFYTVEAHPEQMKDFRIMRTILICALTCLSTLAAFAEPNQQAIFTAGEGDYAQGTTRDSRKRRCGSSDRRADSGRVS